MIKPHLGIYIIKDIFADDLANSSQNQTEILERLSTAILFGEDVIVDLRKNNGATLKFDEFWEVIYVYFV